MTEDQPPRYAYGAELGKVVEDIARRVDALEHRAALERDEARAAVGRVLALCATVRDDDGADVDTLWPTDVIAAALGTSHGPAGCPMSPDDPQSAPSSQGDAVPG